MSEGLVEDLPWMATRRFKQFDVAGEESIFTQVQGRGWGNESTMSTSKLEGLISSISAVGQLQPVLLEQLPDGTLQLVFGERRLRAMRWGATNQPDNPHFKSVAAVIVDGPLSGDDKFRWQIVENMARDDYKPGELAAALLYARAGMLTARLKGEGVVVDVQLDDPVERWDALNKIRTEHNLHTLGVRWDEVIAFLGISLSEYRAKQTVAAFRSLPSELSAEMDAEDVALASRREFISLSKGRQDAANEIWAALKEREQTHLLTRSCQEAATHPEAEIGEVIDLAEKAHDRTPELHVEAGAGEEAVGLSSQAGADDSFLCDAAADTAIRSLAELLGLMRSGAKVSGYRQGTVLLHCREVLQLVDAANEEKAA